MLRRYPLRSDVTFVTPYRYLFSQENVMPQKITHDIAVSVQSFYMAAESDPEQPLYLFAYRVEIANHGDRTVQLLRRHWIITDGDGRVQHVEGEGVVGKQPTLEPGQMFEYSSGCPLPTPVGTMTGTYQMLNSADASMFDISIPQFTLAVPSAIN
jgi:ApaG protein